MTQYFDCKCPEPVINIPVEYTHSIMTFLDDLYTTAVRLTRHVPAAEELVQCTLLLGAHKYGKKPPPAIMRPWLLDILNDVYQTSKTPDKTEYCGDCLNNN